MEIFTPIRISRNKTEDLQNIIDRLVGNHCGKGWEL